jgi:flagellar export protein FliJ
MKRSKRFEPIRDIVSTSATDLSRAMGEAGHRAADLERQLEQLKTYRDEYVKNSIQDDGTMDAVKLQNYRSFLGRLGDAIRQQLTLLDRARAEFENRRLEWSAKRIEAESLGRAIDRFRSEELRDAERREQRDGDDAAMRISIAHTEAGER